jgi:hypothetical protein
MVAANGTHLKDGRLSGVLIRRFLAAMVRRPGQLVTPEDLGADVWPDGVPLTWRNAINQVHKRVNRACGAQVIERIGGAKRLDGYRLNAGLLPDESLTRKRRVKAADWDMAEEAAIREQVGRLPLSGITAAVNAIGGHNRTEKAVEGKIYKLGLSKWMASRSARDVAALFGVEHELVVYWIRGGHLEATYGDRAVGATYLRRARWYRISDDAIERFMRARPWEYDWRAMDQRHPLTTLARVIQRDAAFLSIHEVSRLADGTIEGAQRMTATYGNHRRGRWRIPASTLDLIFDRRRRRAAS